MQSCIRFLAYKPDFIATNPTVAMPLGTKIQLLDVHSRRPEFDAACSRFRRDRNRQGHRCADRRPQLAAALPEARKRKCPVLVAKLDRLCISFQD